MKITELNGMEQGAFVEAIGWVIEHSPWVAERAWNSRPFAGLEAMHAAMCEQVRTATHDEQLALLRAHPDLGSRARMSDASVGEQAGAGLHQLTAEEFHRLQRDNSRYKEKFGFPFLYAVKGSTKHDILAAMAQRLPNSAGEEFDGALQQVFRIARFRLEDTIKED
ncbi:MAG: 2-oxo-4-hydroxy-4-carboxy-5-ureidoimidazoline decarboxylase [Acidobacteria bacterium]|nr:2-oxo-4-hydroxy-4-carboxy-5-ureidoimidazoline decarboxylase [Acidobacteriota bacterium]